MKAVTQFRLILIALAGLGMTTGALAQDGDQPIFDARLRLVPVIASLASSVGAQTFDYSVWIDGEVFLTRQLSLTGSFGLTRMSVAFQTPVGYPVQESFLQEMQFGVSPTYYFSPLNTRSSSSWFVRGHGYYIAPNMLPGENSPNRFAQNVAVLPYGWRVGGEVGLMSWHRGVVTEISIGVTAYTLNPYRQLSAAEANPQLGIGPAVQNTFVGLSPVYPTFNVSIGFGD